MPWGIVFESRFESQSQCAQGDQMLIVQALIDANPNRFMNAELEYIGQGTPGLALTGAQADTVDFYLLRGLYETDVRDVEDYMQHFPHVLKQDGHDRHGIRYASFHYKDDGNTDLSLWTAARTAVEQGFTPRGFAQACAG